VDMYRLAYIWKVVSKSLLEKSLKSRYLKSLEVVTWKVVTNKSSVKVPFYYRFAT